MTTITFFQPNENYGEFSNYYPSEITVDGKQYATVEHYFQSQKYKDTPIEELIRLSSSPQRAAKVGQQRGGIVIDGVSYKLRQDWEFVKDDIMSTGLAAKFTQHKDLLSRLLDTKDADLIELSDSYWGKSEDGRGLNRLGELLMQLRKKLQQEKDDDEKKEQTAISTRFPEPLNEQELEITHTLKETSIQDRYKDSIDLKTPSEPLYGIVIKPVQKKEQASVDSHYAKQQQHKKNDEGSNAEKQHVQNVQEKHKDNDNVDLKIQPEPLYSTVIKQPVKK